MFDKDATLPERIKPFLLPVEVTDGSDKPRMPGQRPASVLMPLVRRGNWQVILTKRPDYMPSHAGQISFPGGRTEIGETAAQGAVRETYEEIGIPSGEIEILGRLPSFNAVSNYRVTPFVGVVAANAPIIPCPQEVAEVFELPFAFFMDEAHHVPREVDYEGRHFTMYDMPWPNKENAEYLIWGMTAMIIHQIYAGFNRAP